MATRLQHVLLRFALVTALLAASVLFLDYTRAGAGVCGDPVAGCGAVKSWARANGVAFLPVLGMGYYAALLAFSLVATTKKRLLWLGLATTGGGLGALAFIALQVVAIKTLCQWCMVVDVAALAAVGFAWGAYHVGPLEEPFGLRMGWGALAATALLLPQGWPYPPPAPVNVPSEVAALYVDDKVDVVMFTDFQCPYCRRLHPALEEAKASFADRLAFHRVMVPLSFHRGAEPAALAYLCTPKPKRDEMADQLYTAPSAALTPSGVLTLAKGIGLDDQAMLRCMGDATIGKELDRQKAMFGKAQLRGLPATFVEDQLVSGANEEGLFEAIDAAMVQGGTPNKGYPAPYMFLVLGLFGLAIGAVSTSVARPVEAAAVGAAESDEESEATAAAENPAE